jgi:nifR3 family TIM-barrel protein
MPFSWLTTSRPIVALAPMAGVTDAAFRCLVKRMVPEVLVFTEFVSTNALTMGSERTLRMLAFDPEIERPLIVQVFGADPKKFLDACRIIEQLGADAIDINMGCPAAKIVSSCYGSALIKKPELAAELVHAAVRAVSIPVSVKTRLGWDTPETLIPFCTKLVEAGASALAVHGRLYRDKFSGTADWEPMYALKRAVNVPVIGNGDITSASDALAKLKNLDGVMIGRAAIGNPWLLRAIVDAVRAPSGGRVVDGGMKQELTFSEKMPLILEHCRLAVKSKGERRGIIEMRKHFGHYISGFNGAKELRMKLMTLESLEEVKIALTGDQHCS